MSEQEYNTLAAKHNDLLAKTIKLAADKKELDYIIEKRNQELKSVIAAINKAKVASNTDLQLLDQKEKELLETVSQIEADKQRLEEDEQALIETTTKLEKLKADLEKLKSDNDNKNKELFKREADISKKERELNTKLAEVEKLQARITKSEHLKESILVLTNKSTSLNKQVDDLEKKKNILMSRVIDMEQILDKEKVIGAKERMLAEKERNIEEKERLLLHHKQKVEDTTFKEYLSREIDKFSVDKPVQSTHATTEDIFKLIDNGHSLVKQGKLEEAKETYYNISNLYEKSDISEDDKRKIYYLVVDLKNEIELGDL